MKDRKCSMCLHAVKEAGSWWCVHRDNEDVRLVRGPLYGNVMERGVCENYHGKHGERDE